MQHQIKDEIRGVLILVAAIWGVFLIDFAIPGDFADWGIVPRRLTGLVGIPLAPFLHADIWHLISNSIPLVILLVLMAGSRSNTWLTVAAITLLSGAMLWLFGRNGTESAPIVHVGASGVIYGLIAFLIVAGFREMRPVPMLVAVLVGFLYGGTLLWGVLPSVGGRVSWDGHLMGALAGAGLAFFTLKRSSSGIGDQISDAADALMRSVDDGNS